MCTDCRDCAVSPSVDHGGAQRAGLAAEKVLKPGARFKGKAPSDTPDTCVLCGHAAHAHAVGLHNGGLAVSDPGRAYSALPGELLVFRRCQCVLADDTPELPSGAWCNVAFGAAEIRVSPAWSAQSLVRRGGDALTGVQATGDGSRTTDFGAFGFGSTVSGFVTAIAAASVLNTLTTVTNVDCFIHVAVVGPDGPGEWIFQTTAFEPKAINMALRPLNRLLQHGSGAAPGAPAGGGASGAAAGPAGEAAGGGEPTKVDQLERLGRLLADGVVDRNEFERLKAEILSQPPDLPPL